MSVSVATILGLLLLCAPVPAPAAEPIPPPKKEAKQQLVPLEFNPGGGPWVGETPFQGASWSALGPGPAKGSFMQARAGIGDRFPVQDKAGSTHFEIELENGVNDHLVVLVTAGDGQLAVWDARSE